MMLREPWRTRLLFVSFAFNLLLVPIAVSRFLPHRPPFTPGLPRTDMMIDHMTRDLPPADAAVFRDTMEAHVGEIDVARAKMIAARGDMSRIMGRVPYDPAALASSIQRWQASWRGWSEAFGRAMQEGLPQLSDQGRKALSEAGRRGPG